MYKKLNEEYDSYKAAQKAVEKTRPTHVVLTDEKIEKFRAENKINTVERAGVEIVMYPGEDYITLYAIADNVNTNVTKFAIKNIDSLIEGLTLVKEGNVENIPENWTIRHAAVDR